MRLNRLDLNQLVALDALLSECNVSRAAERVNLSQPAMSATLARLRDYFGDPLLRQVGRRMQPTAFAEELFASVRDVLLQAQAITQRRPEEDPARIERNITIVASDYVTTVLLAPALARAAREAPGIRFEVRPVVGNLAEELDRGDVDLVIAAREGLTASHPSEPLFQESFSCIVCRDNANVGARLSTRQYLALRHAATVWARGQLHTMDQRAVDAAGLQRVVDVWLPAFTMLPAFVVGTERVATLQSTLARQLAAQWPVRVLACPIAIPDVLGDMQWHRYQDGDAALRWFRALVHATVASLGLQRRG